MSTVKITVKLPEIEGFEDVGFRPIKQGEYYRDPDEIRHPIYAHVPLTCPVFTLRKKRWRAEKGERYQSLRFGPDGRAQVVTLRDDDDNADRGRWESGNYFRTDSLTVLKIADRINQMFEEAKEETE